MSRVLRRLLALTVAAALGPVVLAPGAALGASVVIPVTVLRSHGQTLVVARVTVPGLRGSLPFVVDTGASKSAVDVRLARILHLHRVGRPVRVQGISGVSSEQSYRLNRWKLNGVASLPPATVGGAHLTVGGFGPAGLIGSDVLSRYGRITIDYQHGLLILGG